MDPVEVDFLKQKFDVRVPLVQKTENRGISSAKRDGIVKIMQKSSAPINKTRFWVEMPVNESASDLTTTLE